MKLFSSFNSSLGWATFSVAFAFCLVGATNANEPLAKEAQECIQAAAPVQYGGRAFEDIDPELAIPACEEALRVQSSPALQAYYARALEKDGRTTRARTFAKLSAEEKDPTALTALVHYQVSELGLSVFEQARRNLSLIIEQTDDWQARNLNANLHIQASQKDLTSNDDLATALAHLDDAAEAGSPYALFLSGWNAETGIGQTENLKLAEEFYRRAVAANHVPALAFLGRLLEQQESSEKEAAELLWKAFKAKNPLAIQLLRDQGKERSPTTLAYVRAQLLADGFLKTTTTGAFDKGTKTALMKANGEVIPKSQAPLSPRNTSPKTRTTTRQKPKSRSKAKAKPKKQKREGR